MKLKSTKMEYLWILIGCCLMAGASMGLCVYCAGVFYNPIAASLSVSHGQASLISTLVLVSMACFTLLMPGLMKMVPYRFLMLGGLVLSAGSLVGTAVSFNTGWMYFFAVLEGIGISAFGILPVTAIINNWFYSKTAWVTSLALAFSALTGALFTPILNFLVQTLGWRMGLMLLAFFVVIFLLPSLLLPFDISPAKLNLEAYGQKEAEAEIPAKKNSHPGRSYLYVAVFAVLAASLIGLPQHFTSFAESVGSTSVFGASLLSFCMVGNIVFKLAGGWFGDRIGPLKTTFLLGAIVAAAALGMMISTFAPNGIVMECLAFLYGAAYALSELSTPLLVRDQFGRPRFSRLYALMNFLTTLTWAAAISVVGFFYDAVQGYGWIWFVTLLIALLIPVLSVILMNGGHLPQFKKHAPEPEEDTWKTEEPRTVRTVPVMDAASVAEPMSDEDWAGSTGGVYGQVLSEQEEAMANPDARPMAAPEDPDEIVIELNGDDLDLPAWKRTDAGPVSSSAAAAAREAVSLQSAKPSAAEESDTAGAKNTTDPKSGPDFSG